MHVIFEKLLKDIVQILTLIVFVTALEDLLISINEIFRFSFKILIYTIRAS